MSPLDTFLWGLFGGVGAEVSVVFALRHNGPKDFPHWLKSPVYYIVSVVMIVAGGLIALAYAGSATTLNPILAIQIGASAPLIFRKLSETLPQPPAPPPDVTRID